MVDNTNVNVSSPIEEEEKFELSPEEATGLDGGKPSVINRKRILIYICVFFALFVCGGLLFNTFKQKSNNVNSENNLYASNSSSKDFLDALQTRALNNRRNAVNETQSQTFESDSSTETKPEALLPQASFTPRTVDPVPVRQPPPVSHPPAAASSSQQSPSEQNQPSSTHFKSSLIPTVEGRLFSQGQYTQQAGGGATAPDLSTVNRLYPYGVSDYTAQNDQQNKLSFYDSSGSSSGSGFFHGENSIWIGTIIPGVLETAINTDLPGNITARVTQNIYDSKTGRNILIPQGTLLLARYNSSISYAQHRVQIVWDTMIRPDGLQIDLGGANGVDKEGMSGQAAKYHENWFEYLKAAGIITLFSVADAKMAETSAQFASDAAASNIVESNSAFVNQVGGNFIGRAMNIQPTLTVDNGTTVNVMLNKTLYLPPIPPYPVSQKYILE